jgi:hypothetical protein
MVSSASFNPVSFEHLVAPSLYDGPNHDGDGISIGIDAKPYAALILNASSILF